MADLNQSYHVHIYPDMGITLKRFYIDDPDELGTVEYWKKAIDELYAKMPFPNLWKDLKLELWHMDHPDLLNAAIVQLDDFNLKKDGAQVAAGLHYGNERIALALFSDEWRARWKPDPENHGTPAQKDIDYARSVLSHEVGHWYAREADLFELSSKSYIQKTTRGLFIELYNGDDRYDEDNHIEKFAEAYRATLGSKEVVGTLGNGNLYEPSASFFTLMKQIYWLNRNLRNKNISNFQLKGNYSQWLETSGLWFLPTKTWYALTRNWEKFKWVDGKWKSI